MPSPTLAWSQHTLGSLAIPVGVALGIVVVLLLLRDYLFRWLERLAGRGTGLPELLLPSLRTATPLWGVAIGLAAGLEAAPGPRRLLAWGTSVIAGLIILSVTLVPANVASWYLQYMADRRQIGVAISGLGTALTKSLIFILGGLMMPSTFGIAIVPLMAALGVGGIAVALALRDILSNLFAGIYILAERPVRIGDFVGLETGQVDYVADIGWRTSRIRMVPNNTVIVPNSKLAESIVTVQDREDGRLASEAVGIASHSQTAKGTEDRGH